MDLLGYFYPREIKNWFCDDWIHRTYTKLGKVVQSDRSILSNGQGEQVRPRYNVEMVDDDTLNRLVSDAVDAMKSKL